MKLLFKVFLLAVVILLAYATTLTEPHPRVLWTALIESKAFFWFLISLLAIGGILIVLRFRQSQAVKTKTLEADALLAQAKEKAATQEEVLESLKQQLEDSYTQKTMALESEYERLKEPYLKKIKELKAKNIELKETVAKLMQALKEKKADR